MGKEIGISTALKDIEPWSVVGDSIAFYAEDKLPSDGYSYGYGHRSI